MSRHSFRKFLMGCAVVLFCIPIGCIENKAGYSIRVRVKNQSSPVKIYLRIYTGETFTTVDSLLSDREGNVEFRGDVPLETGMYSTGVKGKNEADFFISREGDQHFSVLFDPEYLKQTIAFTGSTENEAFAAHLKTMESLQRQIRQLQTRMQQNYQVPDSVKAIRLSAQKLQADAEAKNTELEKKFSGSLLALFLKTVRDPVIPEPSIPLITTNREQLIQQYYYQQMVAHYFDNFDFTDSRLAKLPLLKQKLNYFFTQLVVPQPDTLTEKLDRVLSQIKINPPLYAWSSKYLYNLFRESPYPALTEISVYIAEKYILTHPEWFSDSAFMARIKIRIEKAKLNPVGAVVTNLKLQTPEGKTIELHKINAPVTLLYFFNPECEACHAVTDKLVAVYNAYKSKGLIVYAVYVDRNREEWMNYIGSKKLEWMNIYDREGSQGIEQKFDVNAIPMIYFLDKEKRVVGKDIPVESLESYLKPYLGEQ